VSTALTALSTARNTLIAVDITVPSSVQPPGTQGLLTVLGWGAWIVTLVCIAGIFAVAAKMAFSHRRGEGSEAVGQLGWVMGACVLIAAAGPIVNVLI
jgi:hypothetical protein